MKTETTVRAETDDGPIIEITFCGEDADCSLAVKDAISQAIATHQPAGVVLNVCKLKYPAGDHAAYFLRAFASPLTACFVVAPSEQVSHLTRLFDEMGVSEVFGIKYFEERDAAEAELMRRIGATE